MRLIPDGIGISVYEDWGNDGKRGYDESDTIELNPKCAYTIFNGKCYLLPTTDLIMKNALTGEVYQIGDFKEVQL